MAKDSSQEKTEQPTPKRLREARKKGQVFKSKDLEAGMVFIATFAAIGFMQSYISKEFRTYMEEAFRLVGNPDIKLGDIYHLGKMGFLTLVRITGPVVLTAAVTAAIVGFLQVGPVFSMEPLKPQLKKLNMIMDISDLGNIVEISK